MAGGAQSRRNDKPSIKYRHNPHGGAFFDLMDVGPGDYGPSSRNNYKQLGTKAESKSSDIISTADLISGACQIWDFATSSLPVLHHKTTLKHDNENLQKENTFYYPAEEGKIIASTSCEGQNLSVNQKTSSHVSPTVKAQPHIGSIHVAKKHTSFERCRESHMYYQLWERLNVGSNKSILPCKEKGLSGLAMSYEFRNIYGWMSSTRLANQMHQVNCTEPDDKKVDNCCNTIEIASVGGSDSENISEPEGVLVTSDVYDAELTEAPETSPGEDAKHVMKTKAAAFSLHLDYLLHPRQDVEEDDDGSIIPIYSLQAESYEKISASDTSSRIKCQHGKVDDLRDIKEDGQREFVTKEKSDLEICSSTQYKQLYGLAKQEHAFAGAFAGVFVSLCLHPVDTIKTVFQSCSTDQRSIPHISRSIISERGLSGLYRGISSNIASSAPISAVYTFTYESVKGALLPLFAKEYHSLAHCMAGGCASIATSFIFTPSERVKQQMQVGSHYRSCWNALFSIVGKGGLFSLYTGWGAVLCRNVPHSIIKFYMYESLKGVMFSSLQSNAQPTTILTLVCGGLAGSTAAFFTTPFDVVKTRLQTQIPGSVNRYHGVFNTLKEIAKHEGLKGLYRGLTPRLAMYMTQGALFFASYESFKRLFSLETPELVSEDETVEDASSMAS